MRILVLSDLHNQSIDLDLERYDAIFVCGDYGNNYNYLKKYNANIVRGNCDFKGIDELIINYNNKKIFLTHGNKYNVKFSYNAIMYKAISINADICFFGHTHQYDIFTSDNIVFINPGAYKNGYYCEINDDSIIIYCNKLIVKKIDYRW